MKLLSFQQYITESLNERKKYTETDFTKPGQDGDIYFSKREGNAIAIRQGDKLEMLSTFQGKASLAKVIGSDKRWENMGPASERLLIDLSMKNLGGLATRETQTERGKLLFKFVSSLESLNELISSTDAPVYGEAPEEFPEVAIEKKDQRHKNYLMEVSKILKEIFKTAVDCQYDGHKLKETLFPKYKDTKMKMHVTEDGHFRFDSFGKYPDISVNLKNMKKGKHTHESVIKELKSNIKKLEERMPGMPSQSAIASFSSAPHLTGAGAGMMPS
jgi:hypothetical protein